MSLLHSIPREQPHWRLIVPEDVLIGAAKFYTVYNGKHRILVYIYPDNTYKTGYFHDLFQRETFVPDIVWLDGWTNRIVNIDDFDWNSIEVKYVT